MSYPNLAQTIYDQLTYEEWTLIEHYIVKAEQVADSGDEKTARKLIEDAMYVAKANGEENILIKLHKYIKFY